MRLLLVMDSFGSGGAQRQLVQLAVGLHAAGHEVEFFVYQPGLDHFRPVVDAAGIPVHVAPKRWRYSPGVVLSLARVMARGRFDGVLAYLTTPGVYAEVAATLARVSGRRPKVVVSERGPLYKVSASLRLALGMHRLSDHVVTNSRNNREQLLSLWPSLETKASVIYNGIDLAAFSPPSPRPEPAPGRLRLLAVGSMMPSKDALTLVESLAVHRDRHGWTPAVRWAGKLGDRGGHAGYEQRVRDALARLQLVDSWEWLGERDDVPALLHSSDALVHPSLLEGLPNAVCEAMATGLPVIASRIGDNEALVTHGVTGYLHAPGDAAELAACIQQFASLTPASRAAMSAAGRARAERMLGLDRCVREYEELFERLVSG